MPRHDREEVFDLTIPKETAEGLPHVVPMHIHPGEVVEAELVIPDGPVGLAGVRVVSNDGPVWPATKGAWFRGNNERIKREVRKWPTSGRLELEGYNTDKFDHTFTVRMAVREIRRRRGFVIPDKLLKYTVNEDGEIVERAERELKRRARGGGVAGPAGDGAPSTVEAGEGGEAQTGDGELSPVAASEPEPQVSDAPEPTSAGSPGGEGGAPPSEFQGVMLPREPPPLPPSPPPGAGPPPGSVERTPPPPEAGLPSTTYRTVTEKRDVPPATGQPTVDEYLWGHPEVKPGAAILVNILRARFPAITVKRTTGGTFPLGSIHHEGRAVDITGPDEEYNRRVALWVKDNMRRYLTQGLHGPSLSVADSSDVANDYWDAPIWTEHDGLIHIAVGGEQERRIVADNQPRVETVTRRIMVTAPKRTLGQDGSGAVGAPVGSPSAGGV